MNPYESARSIAAKYAAMPPPDDYPLYGDTVHFTDEENGKQYVGEVITHCWFSTPHRNAWVVAVESNLPGCTHELNVKHSEITKVIRKER